MAASSTVPDLIVRELFSGAEASSPTLAAGTAEQERPGSESPQHPDDSASSSVPDRIVREIFRGTGASILPPLRMGSSAQERLGPESLRLLNGSDAPAEAPVYKSWGVAMGVIGLAGGSFLIAVAAFALAWQSIGKESGSQGAALVNIPRLEANIEALTAKMNRQPAPAPAETVAPVIERIAAVETQMHETIESMNHRLDSALNEVKLNGAALVLRLGKIETRQAEEMAELQSLQLRTASLDPAPTVAASADRPMAALRLKSIKAGVAVVEGPQGKATVAVGDTLFEFGKVLKIGKRGRKGVIVTEQGQLSMIFPRPAVKVKAANPT